MVYDKLDNIELYKGLSEDINLGLGFLRKATPDIENGVHQITSRVKAIVSEYETQEVNEYGYEAHKEYIDIHYLISGYEKICSLPLEYLQETKAYNKEVDAAFYVENVVKPQEILLGDGFFTILYPQDGHMPQLCVNEPLKVKKVVVKVKIDE